jgi:hypothetical protein
VSYQSDGREQFTESWSVPASSLPLTVAQLRVSSDRSGTGAGGGGSGTGSGGTGDATPILESSVVGLLADLGQRPTKGPGFGTSAVAVINSSGQVETAVGTLGDCVFVDGTTGPCGGPTPTFIDAEVPAGAMDGTNTVFTLQNPPAGSSLQLFRNGVYLTAGSDYTVSGTAITFINGAQPVAGDGLVSSYRVDPAGGIGQLRQPQGPNVALAQVVCSAAGATNASGSFVTLGSCDIPATALHSGDRFEIRFTFTKTGTASAWDVLLNWGATSVLARHAAALDAAITGRGEAAITSGGAQIGIESYGSILPFLPGLVTAGAQAGLRVDFRGKLTTAGADQLTLSNFTILRYPGN